MRMKVAETKQHGAREDGRESMKKNDAKGNTTPALAKKIAITRITKKHQRSGRYSTREGQGERWPPGEEGKALQNNRRGTSDNIRDQNNNERKR